MGCRARALLDAARESGQGVPSTARTVLETGACAVLESHRPFELNFDAALDLWVFASSVTWCGSASMTARRRSGRPGAARAREAQRAARRATALRRVRAGQRPPPHAA